jgi:hypothetical protein
MGPWSPKETALRRHLYAVVTGRVTSSPELCWDDGVAHGRFSVVDRGPWRRQGEWLEGEAAHFVVVCMERSQRRSPAALQGAGALSPRGCLRRCAGRQTTSTEPSWPTTSGFSLATG